MELNRRHLIRTGTAVGALSAVGGLAEAAVAGGARGEAFPFERRRAPRPVRRVATVRRTLRRGEPAASGYRPVVSEAGEAHLLRTDLGVRPRRGRARRREAVLAYVQLSDVHITDAQSPLRVEFTDRLDDESPLPALGLFTSAYRPHEMLSGHIADAMVQQINRVRRGPVTRAPLALAIQTGDNSDNGQFNEVRWNIDLLDGGQVRVDSGSPDRYEGVADDDATTYDRAYWHPHPAPAGKRDDVAKTRHGFPTVPGLLDAARAPFEAQGLALPWYSVFGNHDGLAQGNFPHTLQLDTVATGPLKLVSTPLGLAPAELVETLRSGDLQGLLQSLALTPSVRTVTADPDRRLITRDEIVEEHFTTSGLPVGHGFTEQNRSDGTAYYSFDRGRCRFVVMDTVNPNGYSNGSLDGAQRDWLRGVLEDSAGKIVMVFSRHTSDTMDNPLVLTGGDPSPRVTGDAVLALLLEFPEVVAWVNGHTHRNAITAHARPDGTGGLWEINTASHIDWPQQSRIIELADNRDGTLSIFTTMVDHAGPASSGGRTGTPRDLAALGRELAANDWHNPDGSGLGEPGDRNTELVVGMPAT